MVNESEAKSTYI